jgi:hypothetical protein
MDALDLLLSKSGWDGVLRPQTVEKAVSALLDADDEVSAILNKADDTLDESDKDDLTDRLIEIIDEEMREYSKHVEGDLVMASQAAAQDALAQLEITDTDLIDTANNVAADWAKGRAAELVGMRLLDDGTMIQNPDSQWAITDTTRDKIRDLVTRAFEDETPIDELADDIQNAGAFSDSRAEMIARTEVARAEVQGNLTGWQQSGLISAVEWTCSADHDDASDCECTDNEEGSPYSIDAVPDCPSHPRCACSLRGVVVPKEDLEEAARSRFTKDNPNHEPAGSPEGGQFASKDSDFSDNKQPYYTVRWVMHPKTGEVVLSSVVPCTSMGETSTHAIPEHHQLIASRGWRTSGEAYDRLHRGQAFISREGKILDLGDQSGEGRDEFVAAYGTEVGFNPVSNDQAKQLNVAITQAYHREHRKALDSGSLTKDWNEGQPRIPAGSPEGGEFAPGGGGEFSLEGDAGPRQGRFSFISRPKVPTSSEAPSGGSTPDNYKGPVYPFTPRLLDKLRDAVKGKTEIDTFARGVNYGSRVVPAEIKSVESASRKIAGDAASGGYEGDPERITDLARNTIVCKPGTEENVLTDVLKKYPDAIVKRKDPSSDPLGFSGLLVKVKTTADGPAEIQINTPAMAYAKGPKNVVAIFCTPKEIKQLQAVNECCHGEEMYQKWRVMPPEDPSKHELAQNSKEYYQTFRQFEGKEMAKAAKGNSGFPLFDAYGAGVPYYIDDPFESVAFRSDGGRETFKKFYGQQEHPIPYTDAMYKEAILSGKKITKEEYDRL